LAWLTDVLERMVSGRTKAHELAQLLPWVWKAERLAAAAGSFSANHESLFSGSGVLV
jgi:hypothetical protein